MVGREGVVGVFEAIPEGIEFDLRDGDEGPFLQLPEPPLVPHEPGVSAECSRGFGGGIDQGSEQLGAMIQGSLPTDSTTPDRLRSWTKTESEDFPGFWVRTLSKKSFFKRSTIES